jgi:hypothetical protein
MKVTIFKTRKEHLKKAFKYASLVPELKVVRNQDGDFFKIGESPLLPCNIEYIRADQTEEGYTYKKNILVRKDVEGKNLKRFFRSVKKDDIIIVESNEHMTRLIHDNLHVTL